MKVASLLSGGKDSVYAIDLARSKGWNVVQTISMAPENSESWMFHYPNPEIPEMQSKLMNIPNRTIKTKGEKEKELRPLSKALEELKRDKGIDGFISGAIESQYQRDRLENISKETNLKSLTPMWNRDPYEMMSEQIEKGYRYIMTQVSSGGLDESWLGREIDKDALEDLKDLKKEIGVHVAGEGGEYEVAVLEAPLFKGKIVIEDAEKNMESQNRGIYNVKKARIEYE